MADDFSWAVQLPGQMIQDIVEAYFNAEMYKREVSVTESKPTTDGYTFIVEYKSEKVKEPKPVIVNRVKPKAINESA